MPSFFETMRRAFMGQPLDDQPQQGSPDPTAAAAGQSGSTIEKGNDATFPVVQVTRVDTRFNGDDIQLYCHIRNDSSEQIMLDRVMLLDTTCPLHNDLQPNQEWEGLVYTGPQLTNSPESHVQLHYKTMNGDYFEANHDATFTYHGETKTYTIDEIHLHQPIRDIYG